MDATEMELAGQIKKHRQALGISQEALAEKIYVSRQTISNWETARTYPDVQSLLLLSVAFDISIDELIKGDVETMEESVRKADHSLIWMYAAEMLLTVIAIVALFFALDSFIEKNATSGFACLLVFLATFATALGLSFAVIRQKSEIISLPTRKSWRSAQAKSPTAPRDTMPSYANINPRTICFW